MGHPGGVRVSARTRGRDAGVLRKCRCGCSRVRGRGVVGDKGSKVERGGADPAGLVTGFGFDCNCNGKSCKNI